MSSSWSKALQDLKNLDRSPEIVPEASARSTKERGGQPEVQEKTSSGFVWTPSQQAVIQCTHPLIRVRALAGTGKSRVLEAFAARRSGRWRYLTFNQALAADAKRRMPSHVKVATFHGLAFARFGLPFQDRFETKWSPGALPKILGRPFQEDAERRWLMVLLDTLGSFIKSASPLILAEHVDRTGWLLARACEDPVPNDVEGVILDAEWLWSAIIQPGAPWPVTHDTYLKLWCLAESRLPVDGILIDEDQDLTPAIHAWLAQHPGIHVRVGDPNQAIYGFRGATVREDQPGEHVLRMPESFRFGEAIAAQANRVLARLGDDRLIGRGPSGEVRETWRSAPHTTLLARTHAGLLEAALDANEQGIPLAQSMRVPQRLAAVLALSRGQRDQIRDPWVAGFPDLPSFETAIKESGDGDWVAACRVVRKHGQDLERRIERLNATCAEDGWKLSTVHAAKGQTFERVALAQDLPLVDPEQPEGREETHLLYVAMTRARVELSLHPGWAQSFARWANHFQRSSPVADLSDSGF